MRRRGALTLSISGSSLASALRLLKPQVWVCQALSPDYLQLIVIRLLCTISETSCDHVVFHQSVFSWRSNQIGASVVSILSHQYVQSQAYIIKKALLVILNLLAVRIYFFDCMPCDYVLIAWSSEILNVRIMLCLLNSADQTLFLIVLIVFLRICVRLARWSFSLTSNLRIFICSNWF